MTRAEMEAALDRLHQARDSAAAAGDVRAAQALTAAMFAQVILGHTEGVDLTRREEHA